MVLTEAVTEPPALPNRRVGTYLLAILEHVDGPADEVRPTAVASTLDVAPASVTNMIDRLDEDGLVAHEPYRGIALTERGERLARHLAWRRCVVRTFLEAAIERPLDEGVSYRAGFELPIDVLRRLGAAADIPCRDRCDDRIYTPA